MAYYEHRLPCDATQIGRFRRDLGEEGLEHLLKASNLATCHAVAAPPAAPLDTDILDAQTGRPGARSP